MSVAQWLDDAPLAPAQVAAALATVGAKRAAFDAFLGVICAAAPADVLSDTAEARAAALADYSKSIEAQFTRLDAETLADLLDVLAAFRLLKAPRELVAPLANVAFAALNALPDDQRRAAIDMASDAYDEQTKLISDISIARTAELVPAATGGLYAPPAEPSGASEFEWPSDAPPALVLTQGAPVRAE